MKYAYAAVITNDKFYPGLCALKYSLARVGTKYPLTAVIPKSMDLATRQLIRSVGVEMVEMDNIDLSEDFRKKNPQKRWNETLFKLSVFNATQFDKVVLLDLDMILQNNIDELFEKPHLSAVAAGHCVHADWVRLNSGLMVIEPNKAIYQGMVSCITASYEERIRSGLGFGDQDVVNFYYKDWCNQKDLWLEETYNCMTTCADKVSAIHGYKNINVFHFAESVKPWQFSTSDIIIWLLRRLKYREFSSARILITYLRYLKKSCPNYRQYQ